MSTSKIEQIRRQKKQQLQELMNHPRIANMPIKFAYFDCYVKNNELTGKCEYVNLTVVSVLSESSLEFKQGFKTRHVPQFAHIAFAFCSRKDTYCKTEGKIIALQRLINSDLRFCKQVPYHGDGYVSMVEAYKMIDKEHLPLDFKDRKLNINVTLF